MFQIAISEIKRQRNCYTFSINLTKNTPVPIATVAIMYGSPLTRKSRNIIRCPCLSATAIATRFALAPIRVPFPPKSAPIAKAYHKGLNE